MSSALPFSGLNSTETRASSHRALLSEGSQVWLNALWLLSWILTNFIFECVSEVWWDSEACVWAVKIPGGRVTVRQARGHTAQTLNNWPGSQVHTHMSGPSEMSQGPGRQGWDLGPDWWLWQWQQQKQQRSWPGREEGLRQGHDPWWEDSLSIHHQSPSLWNLHKYLTLRPEPQDSKQSQSESLQWTLQ